MDSLGKIGGLGNFAWLAVALLLVLSPTTSALAWGDHKQKVYVPVTTAYPVQTGMVAQAPAMTYAYAPVAGAPMAAAPVAMAPGNGVCNGICNNGYNGVYYAPMVGAQVGMAPATYMYSSTASAPQVYNPGASFSPTGSSFFGNVPPRIGDSRMTDDGRKDVLEDLRDSYRETKSAERSRTTLRKALKDQAREKYVEVIGGDVQSIDDLKDSENKEIDQIVNIIMREDSSTGAAAAAPYGYSSPYSYPGQNPNVAGYAPQPMYYYYVYPVAPTGHPHPHHQHHLLHHQ